jgi:glucosamine--fructose-6-phosphate aminotransferase (isomerizing)
MSIVEMPLRAMCHAAADQHERRKQVCGILGYVGSRPCRELLLSGLEKLEYRGYDSAGISLLIDGRLERTRAVGSLSSLRAALAVPAYAGGDCATLEPEPTSGIGHTRWATHGKVTVENAHPHSDGSGRIHLVLNGIIENYLELRERLTLAGAVFNSDTDAEAVAHLIAHHYGGDLTHAVRRAIAELRGHYAFVAICADEPGLLVGARKECPLIVGAGDGEYFLASAIPAFLDETRRIQIINDGEMVSVSSGGVRIFNSLGTEVKREVEEVAWNEELAEKGGFDTFMLKEIHEQPDAVANTVFDCLDGASVGLPDLGLPDDDLRALKRLCIVACGTSYHAGLLGRYAIEEWANLQVDFDIASEYRYRNPIVGPGDLVVGITQSGETADTLAAMRLARGRGAKVVAITNVAGSQATRDSDGVLFTRAGPEIGVAATKTFSSQAAAIYVLALKLARARGTLPESRIAELEQELKRLPALMAAVVKSGDTQAQSVADRFGGSGFFLFLGRHAGLPVALEGALKLKEVSYIPSDAYAAGEMKHGPIALLSEQTPVVCIATDSPVLDKVLSNLAEVRARGAHVVAVATEGSKHVAEHVEEIIYLPRTDWLLQPMLAAIPLQLIAYHVARGRGLDVDRPRNLAKTVTVE